jgi:hypothetical protein
MRSAEKTRDGSEGRPASASAAPNISTERLVMDHMVTMLYKFQDVLKAE